MSRLVLGLAATTFLSAVGCSSTVDAPEPLAATWTSGDSFVVRSGAALVGEKLTLAFDASPSLPCNANALTSLSMESIVIQAPSASVGRFPVGSGTGDAVIVVQRPAGDGGGVTSDPTAEGTLTITSIDTTHVTGLVNALGASGVTIAGTFDVPVCAHP